MNGEKTSILEKIIQTTAVIECSVSNGKKAVGTGFFFSVLFNKDGNKQGIYPYLVTNKHVIINAKDGLFKVKISDGTAKGRVNSINFKPSDWIFHPDESVDVAIMNIAGALNHYSKEKTPVIFNSISAEIIPTPSQIESQLDAIEDIIFIGYPSGIYDEDQLIPIARKGITATPISKNFRNKPQFLIDASVFPGSSGSPVFIINKGMYAAKEGGVMLGGSRVLFLGILSKAHYRKADGDLTVLDVPVVQFPIFKPNEMIDLGVVIKAQVIDDFIKDTIKNVEGSKEKAPTSNAGV